MWLELPSFVTLGYPRPFVLFVLKVKTSKYSEYPLHHICSPCQEIGLVAIMFFFELLFSYVLPSISFYVSLTNLFSIIPFLICQSPKTLKIKEKQEFDSTSTGAV